MSKIIFLIQKSVKRFMMKAIKTDGILALIEIDRSVAKMAENNRGREVWRAIDRILPQGDYQEWLKFWGITQKELDVFMDAGEEAVNKMYKERVSDGREE